MRLARNRSVISDVVDGKAVLVRSYAARVH